MGSRLSVPLIFNLMKRRIELKKHCDKHHRPIWYELNNYEFEGANEVACPLCIEISTSNNLNEFCDEKDKRIEELEKRIGKLIEQINNMRYENRNDEERRDG